MCGVSDGDLARLAGPLRVLTLDELTQAGLSEMAIRTRVRQQRLQRLFREVYLVGPSDAECLSLAHAASLSTSGRGYCSHGWSTFVHGFGYEPRLPVDLMLIGSGLKNRAGIRIHRSRVITPADYGHHKSGIAVTSAARAILDSGDYLTVAQLEGLIADGLKAKKVTHGELEQILSRAGRRAAAKRLAAALADSPGVTRSEAERMLRRLLKQAGIEQPVTDHPIGPFFADFAWVKAKLVVEFDSWGYHSSKPAFHSDRERLAYIASQGWGILPVTWDHLTNEPVKTAVRIAQALAVRP